MLGGDSLFYIVAALLAAIYLLALWKATGRALPEPPPAPPKAKSHRGLRRKLVFLALNLAVYGGAFGVMKSGLSSDATLFWILCDFFLFLGYFFWGIVNVSSHTLAAELEEIGIRSQNYVKGGLQHIFVSNWLFHNPILALVGIANVIAGIVLAIDAWNLRLLAITGYGINFLAFLWLYGQLDEIRIWTDRIEFINGFSSSKPVNIPISAVTQVESRPMRLGSWVGVGRATITGPNGVLVRIKMRHAETFEELLTETVRAADGESS